jgi:hypothetical protein
MAARVFGCDGAGARHHARMALRLFTWSLRRFTETREAEIVVLAEREANRFSLQRFDLGDRIDDGERSHGSPMSSVALPALHLRGHRSVTLTHQSVVPTLA